MEIDEKEEKKHGGKDEKDDDDIQMNNGNNENTAHTHIEIEYPEFNVDEYASRYRGRTKVDRLMHIGNICKSCRNRAYELAYKEVKEGIDVSLYGEVAETAQKILGANAVIIDTPWMQKQQLENDKQMRHYEDEIQRWRNLSNREKICSAYLDAAEFSLKIGNFNSAISRFTEAKSYAGSTKQQLDMNLKIMVASLLSSNGGHVKSEANHAMTTEEILLDQRYKTKINICLGIYYLRQNRYDQCVNYLIETNFSSLYNNGKESFNELISCYDVALYGGLCALATFDRNILKKKILDNTEFKKFLELVPNVNKLIRGFYESEYSNVMNELNNLKNFLLMDPFLFASVDHLLTAIRGRALVQYFSPYSAMDIRKMAKAFGVSIETMENELSRCIGEGHINAKIDSHNKIVYASQFDRRKKIFQNVIDTGEEFSRDMKSVLIRLSCQKENIVVSASRGNMGPMGEFMMDLDEEEAELMSGKGGIMGGLAAMAKRGLGGMGGGGGGGGGQQGPKKRGSKSGGQQQGQRKR